MRPVEISVILAVFNEEKYLPLCLSSLAQQRGVNYEVVVVDDGSYTKIFNFQFSIFKSKKFRFFRIKHGGTARARNFGAKRAQGKILVFIDGDMKFASDFLVKLTEPIREGKSKGTFSTEEYVANWENVWARCWNWENGLPDKRRIDQHRVDMVKDFRAILKSEFERIGGFTDIGYTDTWTLAEKLGYYPTAVWEADYWHYNPDNLNEVFRQAVWIGGRKRRFGWLGKLGALVRATLPVSLMVGVFKSLTHQELRFIWFKLIYDLGIFVGVVGSL